jgi:uncharacterized protein YhaN
MLFLTKLLFFASISTLLGCNKPDPNAYKADPVLLDYQSQLQATTADIEALKKQAEDSLKEFKNSQPQKGQAVVHRKKLEEVRNRISKLEQQVTFWKIRIESRAKEAQAEYLTAKAAGKEWPDRAAVDSYHAQKRLRLTKLQWDQKDRIKDLKQKEAEKTAPPVH